MLIMPSSFIRSLIILLLAIAAAGCGETLRTTIAVHHALPDRSKETGYAFVQFKDQEENPENQSYRNLIRSELARFRYRETDSANAALLLSFSYGIDRGRDRKDPGIFRDDRAAEYRKSLWVFLYEKDAGEQGERKVVYEGSVVCAGPLSMMGNIMPVMIRELFFDFPGESDSKRTVLLSP